MRLFVSSRIYTHLNPQCKSTHFCKAEKLNSVTFPTVLLAAYDLHLSTCPDCTYSQTSQKGGKLFCVWKITSPSQCWSIIVKDGWKLILCRP